MAQYLILGPIVRNLTIFSQNTNNEESIGESGSIFVRNLPYIVSEEEVTALFEKYGKQNRSSDDYLIKLFIDPDK